MKDIKLNIGASPIWKKEGWFVLDHKLKEATEFGIPGDMAEMDLPDESCQVVFCSHVFEHIPHVKLPIVLSEINRVLKKDGILRILTPDLEKAARAYVNRDQEFFKKARQEDQSLRTDLGYGGTLMNFVVSPGQDTVLLNRDMTQFIAGYAHLYNYDLEMMSILMSKLGFHSIHRSPFSGSEMEEMREPLHVLGMPAVYEDLNDSFYAKHGLTHKLVDGKYVIDFQLTGFDRDPTTSLIVECKKEKWVSKEDAYRIFNDSTENYNRYAKSLLRDPKVVSRLNELGIHH